MTRADLLLAGLALAFAEGEADHGGLIRTDGTVDWTRYHGSEEAAQLLGELEARFPDLARRTSIGKSYLGEDLWVLEVTNRKVKPPEEKPGYYVDGGVHAGELTGSEQVLYLAWHLCSTYGKDAEVTRLLDTRTLYLRPKFNPDGADHALTRPDSLRSTVRPWDDDEDGVGGIDMNRNFPRTWALPYLQPGAGPYPLSEPETRATVEFLTAHRNVTGIVHNHTSGGFLYRLPSTDPPSAHEPDDLALVKLFGDRYTRVEIGGWRRKFTQQNPPPKFLEKEIAMKVPWFVYIASVSPLLRIVEARSQPLAGGLHRIEMTVENEGFLPTNLTERALKARLARPVRAHLKLAGAELVEGRAVADLSHIPGTCALRGPGLFGGGAPAANRRNVSWVVRATGREARAELTVVSEKGGTERRTLALR